MLRFSVLWSLKFESLGKGGVGVLASTPLPPLLGHSPGFWYLCSLFPLSLPRPSWPSRWQLLPLESPLIASHSTESSCLTKPTTLEVGITAPHVEADKEMSAEESGHLPKVTQLLSGGAD